MKTDNAINGILKSKNAIQVIGIIAVLAVVGLVMLGGSSEDNKQININQEQQGDGENVADIDVLLETLEELK